MRPLLVLVVLVLATLAAWLAFRREPGAVAPVPEPATAAAARSDAHVLEGAEDPVAPPAEHAERTVPNESTEGTAVLDAARAILAVRVTSVESGGPVANVRITAREEPEPAWSRDTPLTTGEDGLEEFDVRAGTDIVVRAGGTSLSTSSAIERVPALAPGERREVVLQVRTQEDVVVHGIVLRGDTREGVAGVVVQAVLQNPIYDGPETITANDGTFRLALRSYATKELVYSHAQFGTAHSGYQGHESPTNPLVVLLEPGASILVNVVDVDGEQTKWWTVAAVELGEPLLYGRPPAVPPIGPRFGSSIARIEASATISEGSAEVVGLKAGQPLALEVRRGQRVVWRSRAPMVLAPGERRAVTIRVGGASVHGFVREADSRGAVGIEVFAHPAGEDESNYAGSEDVRAVTKTGPDGAYRIDGLEPGAWLVGTTGDSESYVFARRIETAPRIVERLELRGGPARHDIVIAGKLTISGRVLDAAGSGVQDAEVWAQRGSDPSSARTRSGAEGFFSLLVPGEGPWIVQAIVVGGGASAPVVASAGTADVVLRIGPCAGLELELLDEKDEPVDADSVVLVRTDGTEEDPGAGGESPGFWSADCLRPGTCHFVATAAGGLYAVRRDLALAAGSTTKAKIVLSPSGQARVRFDGPGDTASLSVLDHGLLVRRTSVLRGIPAAITGPLGEVELQLQVGGTRHDRELVLEREPGADVVFDGGWR